MSASHLISISALRFLTCKFHELVKVLDGEDWFPEFPEIELEHTSNRVYITCISYISKRVFSSLKCFTEVVYLHLGFLFTVTGHFTNPIILLILTP